MLMKGESKNAPQVTFLILFCKVINSFPTEEVLKSYLGEYNRKHRQKEEVKRRSVKKNETSRKH